MKLLNFKHVLILTVLMFFSTYLVPAYARIDLLYDVSKRPSLNEKEKLEAENLDHSLADTAKKLDARAGWHDYYLDAVAIKYKLHLNENDYYIDGAALIPKNKPSEKCIAMPNETASGEDIYFQCNDGNIKSASGVLFFFNTNFSNVGTHKLSIKEPKDNFVSSIDAISIYNKDRNELLVTVRYSLIDSQFISANREEGVTYDERSSTMLLRLKAVDGKIQVEQDDTCLKNPNKISNIATARKLLKQCEASKQKPVNNKTSQKKTP